ncbi:hypothetical protein [Streptomyces sp. NPDC091219]|uniref:hypothetical protein n=1 Tax=Streptomyces sp. NPDC091219 TaxID=3155193 RepID=UPI00344BD194
MNITRWLATIDLLCARDFPAEYGRTDVGTGGPGCHMAELATSGDFWEGGRTERAETEARYELDRDALGERLTERWGAPGTLSLGGVLERSLSGGEDIPEPWASLSAHVPDVRLWKQPETGRWIALGVSQWDKELPFQLLAVITETDPP